MTDLCGIAPAPRDVPDSGSRVDVCRSILRRLLPIRRVPVILQVNRLECGAACLAMILNYFGRKTRLSECSEHLHVGRDGVSARALADAARHYRLDVKGLSVPSAGLEHVALPAIVHWKFNHFVVVERWSNERVIVVDPAVGRQTLTADAFDAGFTGVVLTFDRGARWNPLPSATRVSRTIYLARVFRGTSRSIGQVVGASLLLQGIGLTLPLLTKVLLDEVIPSATFDVMTLVGLGIVLLVLCHAVTTYLRATLLVSLEARLDSRLMTGFLEHVLRLPFRFFQQRASGDLLMRLGSTATLRSVLTSHMLSAILDGGMVVTYLAILLVVRPPFAALVFGIGVVQAGILMAATPRIQRLVERELANAAASQNYLVELLSGIATLKAAGAEQRAFAHWSNLFYRHLNVSVERGRLSAVVETVLATLAMAAPLLLLWTGTAAVLQGSMTVGAMLALNALAVSFLTPLSVLVNSFQQLQVIGAHLDRIADVLESSPEQDPANVEQVSTLNGRIELRRVGFRYGKAGPWVLRDISLTIEPGQTIALVGPTGSGKSTLARMLLALHTPSEGEVLFDGRPVQCLDYRALRSRCGAVLQDSFLFSGSLRANVSFNDPGLPMDRVIEAARLARIHDDIVQMPMGYETHLSEGGAGLSGGQRQRVALARAVAHRPSILLLDEATSHLDVVTEQEVNRNLSRLSSTRIVIAHRLSTVRNADLILVLDRGLIVERGSHDALVARGGFYAEMVRSQSEGAGPSR